MGEPVFVRQMPRGQAEVRVGIGIVIGGLQVLFQLERYTPIVGRAKQRLAPGIDRVEMAAFGTGSAGTDSQIHRAAGSAAGSAGT